MSGDFDIYGVFVPSLLIWGLVAFALSALLRNLFDRIGLYRFVWHRSLFDFALLVILIGGITALARTLS